MNHARVPERGASPETGRSPGRRRVTPERATLRLQRTIGNRATCRLLQRQDDEDDEVDPELAALYIFDRSRAPLPTLGEYMPPLPPTLVGAAKQAVVAETALVVQPAVALPPPVPEPAAVPEVEKKKRKRIRGKGKKAEAASAPAAPAAPAAPRVPTRDIRIDTLAHGTLAGKKLQIDGREVATVSDEQLRNTAGDRGADHEVPLDILADAARRATNRWRNGKADETAGGNFAYFFPVGADAKTNRWLCVVFNRAGILLTSYVTSRSDVERKIGRGFDAWAKDKHVYPSWR